MPSDVEKEEPRPHDGGVAHLDSARGPRFGLSHRATQALWDLMCWTVAVPAATLLRYDGAPPSGALLVAMAFGLMCGALQIVLGLSLTLYRGRYKIGSFDEVFGLTVTVVLVAMAAFVVATVEPYGGTPRSVPLMAGALALGGMMGGRFLLVAYRQRFSFNRYGERTLVYGAGDSGDQLVRQMLRSRDSLFTPVGFLDDDPTKRHLRLHGRRVLGTIDELERVARMTSATTLLVAFSGADAQKLLQLDQQCGALDVTLRIIPSAVETAGGVVELSDIAQVTEEDILGRHPIHTDERGIHDFLSGKRILITGAGGSIGSELTRQVLRYDPAFVGILDRDESGIQAVQLSIDGQGLLTSDNLILADIRDADRMLEVLQTVRPHIVFHAAALKHLTLLEQHPNEAFKTNVLGTENVLRAAAAVNTGTFVNISTDKAADPTSILGRTKLVTEQLTAGMEQTMTEWGTSRYLSVRFGNVLGSRGSVIPTFHYQIENGGPVTVTDPRVTRYFMTVSEAVQLVLQAAVIGEHGETLILDMGEPVRIDDVARQMINKSGLDIEIVYTGLRPGEKLNEALISVTEETERRRHPLIAHTRVAPLGADAPLPLQ